MGTVTLGNPREKSQANRGASWAIFAILMILIVFAYAGFSSRSSIMSMPPEVSTPSP